MALVQGVGGELYVVFGGDKGEPKRHIENNAGWMFCIANFMVF